jgi:hypothetical protein
MADVLLALVLISMFLCVPTMEEEVNREGAKLKGIGILSACADVSIGSNSYCNYFHYSGQRLLAGMTFT